MRNFVLAASALMLGSSSVVAGGYLTNTNQNAAFLRNVARNASMEIDAAYSNPAGLVFLEDGFHFSLNGQSAYQTRDIEATFPLFGYRGDKNNTRLYEGEASAPIVPSLQAAYKKGDWVVSGNFAITGGGGKCSFDQGLPSFDALVMAGIYQQTTQMTGGALSVTPDMYDIRTSMYGRQYIYGLQLGLTYQPLPNLGVYVGGRMNYYTGSYNGYVRAEGKPGVLPDPIAQALPDMALDVDQKGWGLTPIIGLDYKWGKLNLGFKCEFGTNLNIENDTHENTTGMDQFKDGYSTPNDLPAIVSLGAQYEILPSLRVMGGYMHYFDSDAGMANDKQEYLSHGTNELQFGAEWDITDKLLVSAGIQNTDYGMQDEFQSDLSFSCDSYSVGFGAKLKFNSHLSVNVAYFFTNYEDYTKETDNYAGTGLKGKDVFSRTNKVFGLGIDYSF